MKHEGWKNRIYPAIGAVLAAALCLLVLYAGQNIGLSDNGDFRRVLLSSNITYENETDHYYLFKENYKMKVSGNSFLDKAVSVTKTNTEKEIYKSPHFTIIKISKVLNLISNSLAGRDETDYDIFWLAIIYIFMFAVATAGIFTFFADKSRLMKIVILLMYLFMFCDAGYILYFNSFYGEPLQYVSFMMLIAVGILIYKRPSIPKIICFYISLYFFAGSKLANVPFSIIVSLLAAVIMIMRDDKAFKTVAVASAVISVGCMIYLYVSIPSWMQNDTTYQSVFFGIVKESDTPEKDLEELGVDPKYAVLQNTNAYMDKDEYPIDITTDTFQKEFYDKVSKTDILFFYLRHPGRLVGELKTAIENSAYIRPPNAGNSSTELMEITDRFSGWSNIRVALKFPYQPIVIFIVFIVLTVYVILVDIFLIYHRRKESPARLYMLCAINILVIGLWLNLILPVIGNGEADIAKHMFLFIHCIDILIFILIAGMFTMKKKHIIISVCAVAFGTSVFYISPPKKTVTFGTYQGKPLKWEVVSQYNDNSMILVTRNCVSDMEFDPSSNMWESSELRNWLNNDFLNGFTNEEKSKIKPVTNEVMLSYNDKNLAVAGNHKHFWNFTRNKVADLSKTAYHYYLDDKVFIPTLDMINDIDVRGSYWVLCPYAGNDKMERYMKNDGFILHTDVANKKGVRAVIRYVNDNN